MLRTLKLYSTTGCHLCDRAEKLLVSMPELKNCAVTVVDIVDDPSLFDRYAEHIPVLEQEGGTVVLYWPFNADQILDWLDDARV